MKILFTCDLHGRPDLYVQLIEMAEKEKPDCIIIGGDLFPSRLEKPFSLITGDPDFGKTLTRQIDFIDTVAAPLLNSCASKNPGTGIFYIPGNHDWFTSIEYMEKHVNATCIQAKTVRFRGLRFSGYACTPDSPFWVKDYVRRDTEKSAPVMSRFSMVSSGNSIINNERHPTSSPTIEEELAELNDKPDIFVSHCPPHETGLDTMHDGRSIGSRAIRNYILGTSPLVSLHGHIHEAPYVTGKYITKLGSTYAINPGCTFTKLHAVIFDTEKLSFSHNLEFSPGMNSRTSLIMPAFRSFIMERFLTKR